MIYSLVAPSDQDGAGARARSQEHIQNFRMGDRNPVTGAVTANCRIFNSRKLESGARLGMKARQWDVGHEHPNF